VSNSGIIYGDYYDGDERPGKNKNKPRTFGLWIMISTLIIGLIISVASIMLTSISSPGCMSGALIIGVAIIALVILSEMK